MNKKKKEDPKVVTAPAAPPDKHAVLLTMLNNAHKTSLDSLNKINAMIQEEVIKIEQLRGTKLRLEGAISVTHKILTHQISKT